MILPKMFLGILLLCCGLTGSGYGQDGGGRFSGLALSIAEQGVEARLFVLCGAGDRWNAIELVDEEGPFCLEFSEHSCVVESGPVINEGLSHRIAEYLLGPKTYQIAEGHSYLFDPHHGLRYETQHGAVLIVFSNNFGYVGMQDEMGNNLGGGMFRHDDSEWRDLTKELLSQLE